MKKGTKIGIGLVALMMGAMVLTGCTNSFCSLKDKANILYALDYGVCKYYDTEESANTDKNQDQAELDAAPEKKKSNYEVGTVGSFTLEGVDIWYYAKLSRNTNFYTVYKNARDKQGLKVPSLNYYVELDKVVLQRAIEEERKQKPDLTLSVTAIVGDDNDVGLLVRNGYLKFYDSVNAKKLKLWTNWDSCNEEVRNNYPTDRIDECAQKDYVTYFKSQMNSKISSNRSCLAIREGYYGNYRDGKSGAFIEKKDWGYAWKTGPFSGLLVYPIGWLIDTFATGILKSGGAAWNGWAQLLAILFVTIIVRSLMLAATFKQTTTTSRMQELQPEIAKIQAKYPNSNTNQYEKQRLAQETQALYKKHKINPFTSIIVMIVQFPVFICVWGAMQGSAILSSGAVLGLDLSKSMSSVLTTWSNWANPASGVYTALGLFLLMSGAQVVAMLLPQWMQKAERKKIAKLGRNPAQKESDNKTKWFTYIMLGMIIIMGFSLVSALGVYWLVGALFSVAQTLITHAVMHRKKKNK